MWTMGVFDEAAKQRVRGSRLIVNQIESLGVVQKDAPSDQIPRLMQSIGGIGLPYGVGTTPRSVATCDYRSVGKERQRYSRSTSALGQHAGDEFQGP